MSVGILILVFLVGVPLFLLFEHPLIFWLIFLPLAVMGIIKFITWLKK